MPYPIRNPKPAARNPAPPSRATPRQKRTLVIVATLLIVVGLAVLFLLHRMPLPLRIVVGLTDLFAGLGLLVLVRQH